MRPARQPPDVALRHVELADLRLFFEHQRDPAAARMAALAPRDEGAFLTHWTKILADDRVIKQTVVLGDQVAGNIVCFEQGGRRLVGYWLGTSFWGRGIATSALSQFVAQVRDRPLHAWVAVHNVGSIRVLEKCGFVCCGDRRSPATEQCQVVDELLFALAQ